MPPKGHIYGKIFPEIPKIMKNCKNPKKGLEDLFAAEALGSSRPLPEIFSRAGIRFDFSAATIEPLIRDLSDEIARLKR